MAIGKKNKVRADLSNYSVLFNGIAGIGTFCRLSQ